MKQTLSTAALILMIFTFLVEKSYQEPLTAVELKYGNLCSNFQNNTIERTKCNNLFYKSFIYPLQKICNPVVTSTLFSDIERTRVKRSLSTTDLIYLQEKTRKFKKFYQREKFSYEFLVELNLQAVIENSTDIDRSNIELVFCWIHP